jgi:hypothetical protein
MQGKALALFILAHEPGEAIDEVTAKTAGQM